MKLSTFVDGLDYPMYVVTVAAGGERSGCLVGFGSQVSIDPPRFLVCISVVNHTHAVALGAALLAVHLLSPEEHALAELFGSETGDEIDKFERCSWRLGAEGVPILDGVRGWVAGPVVARMDVGDHVAFVVDAEAGAAEDPSADQLGFFAVQDVEPGHEP